MTDWKTTKIKGDVKDRAKALEGHTFTEIMEAGCDALEGADPPRSNNDTDIAKKLDRNYEAIKEATDAAQTAAQTVEEVTQG